MIPKRLQRLHYAEDGIELIEWIAIAAVLALTIAGIGFVLTPGGSQVGQTVTHGIVCWASGIGGGGGGACAAGGGGAPTAGAGTQSGSGSSGNGSSNGSSKPGFWGQVGGFFVGIGSGAWDTIKGIGGLAWDGVRGLPGIGDIYGLFDPNGTAAVRAKYARLWDAIKNDPLGTGKQMLAGIVEPIVSSWKDGQYGKAIGRGVFEIGMLLIPETKIGDAGEAANAADKAAEAANAADKAAEAANAASKAGEAANAADKVLEAANELAKVGLGSAESSKLIDTIAEAATAGSTSKGITVLGHFPGYVDKAKELGAAYLNFPPGTWDALSDAERWAVNQRFIDMAIARGDTFVLSTPLNEVRAGSYLEKELQYLASKGYQVVERNGVQVIVPK